MKICCDKKERFQTAEDSIKLTKEKMLEDLESYLQSCLEGRECILGLLFIPPRPHGKVILRYLTDFEDLFLKFFPK